MDTGNDKKEDHAALVKEHAAILARYFIPVLDPKDAVEITRSADEARVVLPWRIEDIPAAAKELVDEIVKDERFRDRLRDLVEVYLKVMVR